MENAHRPGNHFYGVFSLFMIFSSFTLALIVLISFSPIMGAVYAALLALGMVVMLYSFCAKCPCRLDGCGHVLPGKATRWLPRREPGDYLRKDIVGGIGPFFLMVAVPQYALWAKRWPLFVFWLFLVTAIVLIRRKVCPPCTNDRCPAKPKQ